MAVTATVVQSGAGSPKPIPDQKEISASLSAVMSRLAARYDKTYMATFADLDKDHAKTCTMISALYRQILALPKADGAPLLWYLFGHS
jgi:hypothetical protein